MNLSIPTVIVVGTGGAGMCAAIEAAKSGAHVYLVTKSLYTHDQYRWASNGGCTWKTHAFNAAVGPGDSVEAHIEDTLRGGAFANNPDLARVLCEESVVLVEWLQSLGLKFEMDGLNQFVTRPFGGCGSPRGVYLEDRLGFYIQKVLVAELKRLITSGSVSILTGLRGIKILKNSMDQIEGLQTINIDTLELVDIPGSAIILADGGGASMYSPSAASFDKTCDGLAMGLKAGAEAIDLEFVQFHPTGLASGIPTFDGSLVEEAVRFDGAKLINKEGHRFMFDYHPKGETATRDMVSRGIYSEILADRCFENYSVDLDISSCRDVIASKYPALLERLRQADFDPKDHSILKIRPTAHYLMGGLRIDAKASCTIPGLFAAGESAGGVHGANRLGGNGLSEALVFGRIAGKFAAEFSQANKLTDNSSPQVSGTYRVVSGGTHVPETILNRLRKEMYFRAGPVRNPKSLSAMSASLCLMEEESANLTFSSGSRASLQIQSAIDLQNLLLASKLIVEAALCRKESRGSHYRSDYTETLSSYTGCSIRCDDSGGFIWNNFVYSNSEQKIHPVTPKKGSEIGMTA
ncbi:MAG: FAD-binding protein [Deltaproteobacteria bacterium]|nr:FAD-binding protein [Deltaproteobacteria bacterium]